jgi:uncharacterized SAM-binding protein YcdF (DUF218 family)
MKLFTRKALSFCLIIFGTFTLLYFIFALFYLRQFDVLGMLASFFAVFIIIFAVKLNFFLVVFRRFPKIVQRILFIGLTCIVLSFVISQSMIIFNMRNTSKSGADFVMVLGCRVVGEYASLPLLGRGYTAIRYLKNNPATNVILTGGQGSGENISEAEALRRLLRENNIDEERIFIEDVSTSTMENFINSHKLYSLLDKNIVVVTSDYHMFRSLSIAKKLKYENVSGLPTRSQSVLLPIFLLREYVAVMYYKIMGRI